MDESEIVIIYHCVVSLICNWNTVLHCWDTDWFLYSEADKNKHALTSIYTVCDRFIVRKLDQKNQKCSHQPGTVIKNTRALFMIAVRKYMRWAEFVFLNSIQCNSANQLLSYFTVLISDTISIMFRWYHVFSLFHNIVNTRK
jgi:hypothetical protein